MFAVSAIFVYVLIEYSVLPAHHTIKVHTLWYNCTPVNLIYYTNPTMTLSELHRPESGNWNMNDASNEK